MSKLLNLDAAETAECLPFNDLIAALRKGFTMGCQLPERHHHTTQRDGEDDATLLLMPWTNADELRQFLGVKLVTVVPGNAARGLPGLVSTYLLYDGLTGEQLALLVGYTITGRRTVATSALAASYLSRKDSGSLQVCGAGRVGSLIPDAFRAVRPIADVAVWDKDNAAAERLVDSLDRRGFRAEVANDLGTAVGRADIVSAAILATTPFIEGRWIKPGTHVDLIGGFTPHMREPDDVTISNSQLYIDTHEALHEAGDLVQPIKAGLLSSNAVRATLAELCRVNDFARYDDSGITCFKAVGSGLADLVAAKVVFQHYH